MSQKREVRNEAENLSFDRSRSEPDWFRGFPDESEKDQSKHPAARPFQKWKVGYEMSNDESKEMSEIEQISFFRSYFEVGEQLETDEAKGFFYTAMLRYVFSSGTQKPDFSEYPLMRIGWTSIKHSLDKSLNQRRPGSKNAFKNKNANKTRFKRDSNANTVYDIDKDIDIDNKESTKETAEPFSLTNEQKKIPFSRWTEEQFREEVRSFPEYSVHASDFLNYWTERDTKGKMRFQLEKTWETYKRLRIWANRQFQIHSQNQQYFSQESTYKETV